MPRYRSKYLASFLIKRLRLEFARRVGHPAPFHIELPYRLIQLYTFENDVVLDPFIGSGTTAIAAIKTNRRFVGYDINQAYVEMANKRTKKEMSQTTIWSYRNKDENKILRNDNSLVAKKKEEKVIVR